ncbi:hypothetical protein WQE_27620, partial [Paraburkholderia hospita]
MRGSGDAAGSRQELQRGQASRQSLASNGGASNRP